MDEVIATPGLPPVMDNDQGFQMVMLIADRVAMMNCVKAEAGRLTGWSALAPVVS